ncbi:MAG TPA: aminodeoxychorismate synthase component I [Steroidobacteraceae bacterium]|jgi:anthranilate synthase component 1|nr:aminodeoxychorismate synthase component I [Steroidobacteraceae bacterium]
MQAGARGAPSPIIRAVTLRPGILAALAASLPDRYPVLLDSAAEGPLARASILGAFPSARLWRETEQGVQCDPPQLLAKLVDALGERPEGFLDCLDALWRSERSQTPARGSLPFTGGWMVYLGYEMASEVEPRLRLPQLAGQVQAIAWRVPLAVVQNADGTACIVAEAGTPEIQVSQVLQDLLSAPVPAPAAHPPAALIDEEPAERFLRRVAAAQEYIRAGDIYQANLSRPWHVTLRADAGVHDLYQRLRTANPSPFAALLQFGGTTLLSSSPERLLRIGQGQIETRPIAGTHPRGATAEEDRMLAAKLLAHPKERAEHVMLIDLERNDLGRVCEAGSVHVDEYMAVETYAHVHHIVSNVRGRLRPDVSPVGALRAVFPGGTITGCPKFRCMQIIAELEGEPRGAYTGSLGYINLDGSADFNILIRTMSLQDRTLVFRAGGGIVADSNAERELHETRAKARGLLLALT